MRKVPGHVYAVIDGDNNEPLYWFTSKRKAAKECAAFNRLEGYEPNCFVRRYVLAKAPVK